MTSKREDREAMIEKAKAILTDRRDDFDAADAAFKKRDEHATWGDPMERDAAVRWHWRGFQDGAELARRPVQGEPTCQHGTPLTELCEHVERLVNAEPQGEPNTWSVERAAVALYRLDHPAYLLHTFEAVPLLDTVLAYRKRAWAALRAAAVPEGENRG